MAEDDKTRVDEIATEIGRLVGELTRLRNPDDDPIIVGWVLAYEWTSVRLEQDDNYGTGRFAPPQQSGAMSCGLFALGSHLVTDGDGE